jgi:RHH-type transcriptional regulator, rel operon repressor / antitoxin RelB
MKREKRRTARRRRLWKASSNSQLKQRDGYLRPIPAPGAGRQGQTTLIEQKEGELAKRQINVRLDDDVVKRLEALALKTGRTKTFYATEAIREFLDDREDYFLAKDSLQSFVDSGAESLEIDDLDWEAPSQ